MDRVLESAICSSCSEVAYKLIVLQNLDTQEVETATKLGLEASCQKLEAQCDEVRIYFRGYGAIDFPLQSMFTTSNTQQSRHISLSHGPYDLISTAISPRAKNNLEHYHFICRSTKREKH